MLTKLKVYSSWQLAPALLLDEDGRAETDLIQIRNIDGLEPVKASVNMSQFASIDGGAYAGSTVFTRNIVLTLHPNPNWDAWLYEDLRRLAYAYFMPKRTVRMVFESDDLIPVEIFGIVEDISPSLFSSDPEYIVSIICADPYFTSLEPTIVTGQTGDAPVTIEYNGNIETGIYLKLTATEDTPPSNIAIQVGDPRLLYFPVDASVNSSKYFEMKSLPMKKFVQNVDLGTGILTSLLSKVSDTSQWPILQPGENKFSVNTDVGVHDWELIYFERFGGL